MNKVHLRALKQRADEAIERNDELVSANENVKELIQNLSVYQHELEAQREALESAEIQANLVAAKFSTFFRLCAGRLYYRR